MRDITIIIDVMIGGWLIGCFFMSGMISAMTKEERKILGVNGCIMCVVLSWFALGIMYKLDGDYEKESRKKYRSNSSSHAS